MIFGSIFPLNLLWEINICSLLSPWAALPHSFLFELFYLLMCILCISKLFHLCTLFADWTVCISIDVLDYHVPLKGVVTGQFERDFHQLQRYTANIVVIVLPQFLGFEWGCFVWAFSFIFPNLTFFCISYQLTSGSASLLLAICQLQLPFLFLFTPLI